MKDNKILHQLLVLLYPDRCPVCDRVMQDRLICPQCAAKLTYARQPLCCCCGKPVASARQEYCPDCSKKAHEFSQGRAVFVYRGPVRGMLYRYKYSNRRDYTEFFAREAARCCGHGCASLGSTWQYQFRYQRKDYADVGITKQICLRKGSASCAVWHMTTNYLCVCATRLPKNSFRRRKEKII